MSGSAADQRAAMDRMYRYQRHIYDLTRRYYLLGRNRLIAGLRPPRGGAVLEMGCGTGRNLVLVARRYPEAAVCGLDISEEMLKSATRAAQRNGLIRRIMMAEGDATSCDIAKAFGRPGFDRIFFSYTLSMIPDWRIAIDRALDLLSPRGELHIVDFGGCENLPQPAARLLFRWLAVFAVEPRAELRHVLEAQALRRNGSLRFEPLYHGYASYAILAAN